MDGGRPLVPAAPSPLPPESLSELTEGCSGEDAHSPGSTGLCGGRPGREGRERPLYGCALPRERGSGDAWVTGSGARLLLSLLSLLSRLPMRLLPCPAGSSRLALQRTHGCCPQRGDVPSRVQGEARAKSKQRGGERERGREGEKERESQTESGSTNGISGCPASGDNKQAWSPLPGLVGGERAEGLSGSSADVLRHSGGGCHFSLFLQDKLPSEVSPTHLDLEISHLNAAPKL